MRRVIGIDPGPVPGIVALDIEAGRLRQHHVVQCTAQTLELVVDALHETAPGSFVVEVAIERFVARGRASTEQRLTAEQVTTVAQRYACVIARSASQVKPWATDTRLAAAGLLEAARGMRHARDAARQALFQAVTARHLTDPLSNHSHPKDPS